MHYSVEMIEIINKSYTESYTVNNLLHNDSNSNDSIVGSSSGYIKSIAYIYVIVGSLVIILNAIIILVVLRHRILRAKKEYIFLIGLFSANLLTGIATLLAGAYHWDLIDKELKEDKVNLWQCVRAPHFLLFVLAINMQVGMFVVMSVDRLIAVMKPLQHNIFTRRYSLFMIGICYWLAFVFTGSLLLYLLAVYRDSTDRISPLCFYVDIDKTFDSLIHGTRICVASVSVVLYLIVSYLYCKYNRATIAQFPSTANKLRRLQLQLTITVGICSLFTFVLYIIPATLPFLVKWTNLWPYGDLFWMLNCANAIVNVFVYSLRQEDVKMGLKLLLYCRELPSEAEL